MVTTSSVMDKKVGMSEVTVFQHTATYS